MARSGSKSAGIASPKASLIFGPWSRTEYFINYGWGYHSNDAHGATETITPKERESTQPVTPLVRSKGGEVGLRTEIVPKLQSSIALWQLRLGSELVFSGDAGDTEPNRPSQRYGIEWNNHYVTQSWLLFDLDLAASRARFTRSLVEDGRDVGNFIPGSIDRVASVGATVTEFGGWFGQFQLRHFGERPLIEDNSQRSAATTPAHARVVPNQPRHQVNVDVFNLFNRKASDIDYYYASRLRGEACAPTGTAPCDGTNDTHFHPVEPRSVRLAVTAKF